MGTITLLVGLLFNCVLALMIDDDESDPREYYEVAVAKCLAFCGLVVGIPVWLALVSTAWPQLLVLGHITVFFGSALYWLSEKKYRRDRNITLTVSTYVSLLLFREKDETLDSETPEVVSLGLWCTIAPCSIFGLVLVWLLLGINQIDAWLLAGATILEFILPLAVTLFSLLGFLNPSRFPVQIPSFLLSMCAIYVVIMLVPASLLLWETDVGILGCAPTAFMEKRIKPFFTYTFFLPANDAFQKADELVADDVFAHRFLLWMTQIVSFFT